MERDWNKIGAITTIVGTVINSVIGVASLALMWWSNHQGLPIHWWLPVLICATLLLTGILFHRAFALWRQPLSPAGAQNGDHSDWLSRLADDQDHEIARLVHFPRDTPALKLYRESSEPFAEVIVKVINASVFNLKAQTIEGRLKWGENEFLRDMELTDHSSIRPGERAKVTVRQPIRPEEIGRMIGKRILFGTEGLTVRFAYTSRQGRQQYVQRTIPSSSTHALSIQPLPWSKRDRRFKTALQASSSSKSPSFLRGLPDNPAFADRSSTCSCPINQLLAHYPVLPAISHIGCPPQ